MTDDDIELDADAEELLVAMRRAEGLPHDVAVRVWRRVGESTRPRVDADRWIWTGVAAAAALMLLIAGLRGARTKATVDDVPTSQARFDADSDDAGGVARPPAAEPKRTPSQREPAAAPAPTTEPPATTSPPPAGSASAPTTAPSAKPSSTPPVADDADGPSVSVAAELALLERVRLALVDDEPERALELTAEHTRRFPNGAMVEERNALRAVARCEAEPSPAARSEAASFLKANPRSTLAGRVRTACGLGEKKDVAP